MIVSDDTKVATRPTYSLFRAWKVDRLLLAFRDFSQPPTLDVYYAACIRAHSAMKAVDIPSYCRVNLAAVIEHNLLGLNGYLNS